MLNKQELYELISKIGLFVFGVTLGLAAKLARMNKNERLTLREFVYHTTVAMAAAWGAWHFFILVGRPELATGASVVVGRFADDILLMLWNSFKLLIKQSSEKL
jgi:hypothetical protein